MHRPSAIDPLPVDPPVLRSIASWWAQSSCTERTGGSPILLEPSGIQDRTSSARSIGHPRSEDPGTLTDVRVCWHTCNGRRSNFLTISTLDCDTKPNAEASRCPISREKRSRRCFRRRKESVDSSPLAPVPVVGATSPSGSKKSLPARSAHRTDRRCRAAVFVHRSRRPAPRCEPRPARNPPRATDRADPRRHRSDLPSRHTSRR